jgi:Ca2+-binding EF-hand superfamily protein
LKRELENSKGFSVRKAFKAIDELRIKYINEANLRTFLKRMGHQCLKSELVAILRRFDLDGDSKISFPEFSEAIKPTSIDIVSHQDVTQAIQHSPTRPSEQPSRYYDQ